MSQHISLSLSTTKILALIIDIILTFVDLSLFSINAQQVCQKPSNQENNSLKPILICNLLECQRLASNKFSLFKQLGIRYFKTTGEIEKWDRTGTELGQNCQRSKLFIFR